MGARRREAMTLYGEREDEVRPVLQIAMPRLLRLYAPSGTMHVVARCNNREFHFTTAEDFEILLDCGRQQPYPAKMGSDQAKGLKI